MHGISIDVLAILGDAQLKELGITSKSDRNKILSVVNNIRIEQKVVYQPTTLATNEIIGTVFCYPF